MSAIEVKVPDIGDFQDVPVIEIFVKPGDTVNKEDSLVSLESDKATMDVPSPATGVVKELKVKLGDKLSEGSLILTLDSGAADAAKAPSAAPKAASPAVSPTPAATPASVPASATTTAPIPAAASSASTPAADRYTGKADIECDMMVLGSGPGGYSAAFRSADLGMRTVMIERYAALGGVCLNVGCIPSKALLHIAAVMDEAAMLGEHGISYPAPSVDLVKLRAWKDKVVGKLSGGVAGMAKGRKVEVVRGYGTFLNANHIQVELTEGAGQARTTTKKVVRFQKAIIAAGSQAVWLPFAPEDPRIVDSTGALDLAAMPKRMLVVGGGIIGLEMGTVYSTLGARLDVVEMLDGLMQGADRDLVKVWEKINKPRFDRIMLKTKTTAIESRKDAVYVTFEGEQAPSGPQPYDLVLLAVGRTPNGKKIGADKAGVVVTDRGFIPADNQLRTNVPHIFAIGDIIGQPMLAHKATHEGHVAAEVAAGQKSYFDARVIPSVAYTDPEVAWAGVTEDEAKAKGIKLEKSVFPWVASGRAIANGRDEGFTKLLFDAETHRIVGGAIVGTHAGDLIGELALAIEMGADATDIGKTIHPHPTLCESVGLAAELFEGVCTDLPPAKKEAMTQDEQKLLVAREAIKYVVEDTYVGVGSGSTANFFIDELAKIKGRIKGAVASSVRTADRLRGHGIPVLELTSVDEIPVYVDGADATTVHGAMVKGGGGALTREKIVAAVAAKFVCIVDESKVVDVLGSYPLPVEVVPMARSHVARELVRLGGSPALRTGFVTDNGNVILDVEDLDIVNPVQLEAAINNIVGVVTNGLFAKRGADIILVGSDQGVKTLDAHKF